VEGTGFELLVRPVTGTSRPLSARGIAPSGGEADSVAGGTGGLKPRSSAGGSILTGAFNEKSPRLGLGKRFVKMPRAVLIPGIISRSERRPG
jgi:hypothetical protein